IIASLLADCRRKSPPLRNICFRTVTYINENEKGAFIHNGVIAVFQRKGLPDHELYNLNEGVRQLLKTELGSFFTEYLQVGMCFLSFKSEFFLYLGFMCTFR
uniref:Uncharacterized protein n=1 Tax=Pavo cristatus TaxID=9049 RepID=A0A8C9F298_PAVCR